MPSNKEIIEAGYASFAKGDVPAVVAMMDPKIEWTEAEGFPLYSGTLVGPQAIVDGVFMRSGRLATTSPSMPISSSRTVTPWRFSAPTPEPQGFRRAGRGQDGPRVEPRWR